MIATATPTAGEALVSTWREWEIELVAGSGKLLTAAGELLFAAGRDPVGVAVGRDVVGHCRSPAVDLRIASRP